MRFSIWPTNQQPPGDVLEVAAHAGATGWDGVWMADHLLPSGSRDVPVCECWTMLTLIAATVPRLRVGTLVMNATFRPVGTLAKMAATLAFVCPGRLVLGLGAGWQRNEHDAFGFAFDDPRGRLDRLEETCVAVRGLLRGEVITVTGSHVTLTDAVVRPVPDVPVPILVGAKGDRALRVVARQADEWNIWADTATFRERSATLDRACEGVGRDPASIQRSAQAVVHLSADGPLDPRWAAAGLPVMAGSPDEMISTLCTYRDLGLDEFVVPDFAFGRGMQRLECMDRFLGEVVEPFRAGRQDEDSSPGDPTG